MAAPYSDDLRRKAIDAFDRGERKSHICRTLNIGRSTFDTWLQRREDTGSFSANRDYLRGPEPKISDLAAFRQFAEANGHLTQKAMAELWPTPISDRTISKVLKQIGFTRKKRLTAIESEMRLSGKRS